MVQSGLLQAVNILKDVKGIEVIELDNSDVIRHRLVTDIIKAYDNIAKETGDKELRS